MTLQQLNKIHLRLSSKTDFCILYLLYKKGPMFTGDVVNLMRLNSPESSEGDVQNMANQLVKRNVNTGLMKREKTERLKNQPGRSSTLVSLVDQMIPFYIHSLLSVEKDEELRVWSDRYTKLEKSKQLFAQKYS